MVEGHKRLKRKFFLTASLVIAALALNASGQNKRTASGIIYFTNNTPRDLRTFPVEVLTRDKKRVVAATQPDERSQFEFSSIKPGKYLLRLTWPNRCVLWYRIDLTRESKSRIRIIMDAACAHTNGTIQDLPVN